jgi:hypothetical protein
MLNETDLTHELNRHLIPARMHPGILNYLLHGVQPGNFLTAVLKNDLKEAIMRADDENIIRLPSYVRFFYNNAPIASWGSPEKFHEWITNPDFRNDITDKAKGE